MKTILFLVVLLVGCGDQSGKIAKDIIGGNSVLPETQKNTEKQECKIPEIMHEEDPVKKDYISLLLVFKAGGAMAAINSPTGTCYWKDTEIVSKVIQVEKEIWDSSNQKLSCVKSFEEKVFTCDYTKMINPSNGYRWGSFTHHKMVNISVIEGELKESFYIDESRCAQYL